MGKIVLYGTDVSPPVRAVMLTLNALELPYELKAANFVAQDNKSEEYRKVNPVGTVPALVDDGHAIGDSHAINAYLASKYGKDDSLYPKDLVKRSVVDQCLYYDTGVVFERALRGTTKPIIFDNQTAVTQSQIDIIAGVYETVNGIKAMLPVYLDIDAVKYPNLLAWFKRVGKLPYYEKANGNGAKTLCDLIKSKNIKIVP